MEEALDDRLQLREEGRLEAYANLSFLQGQLKEFKAGRVVLDESWTYVRVRRGPMREDLWVWNAGGRGPLLRHRGQGLRYLPLPVALPPRE